MNVKELLKIIDGLMGLDLIESLLYKEIALIEETGNPTTQRYKNLQSLRKLLQEK